MWIPSGWVFQDFFWRETRNPINLRICRRYQCSRNYCSSPVFGWSKYVQQYHGQLHLEAREWPRCMSRSRHHHDTLHEWAGEDKVSGEWNLISSQSSAESDSLLRSWIWTKLTGCATVTSIPGTRALFSYTGTPEAMILSPWWYSEMVSTLTWLYWQSYNRHCIKW